MTITECLEDMQRMCREAGDGRTFTFACPKRRVYFITATEIRDITIPGPELREVE